MTWQASRLIMPFRETMTTKDIKTNDHPNPERRGSTALGRDIEKKRVSAQLTGYCGAECDYVNGS